MKRLFDNSPSQLVLNVLEDEHIDPDELQHPSNRSRSNVGWKRVLGHPLLPGVRSCDHRSWT